MSDVVIQTGVNPNDYGDTHSERIDFLYDALNDNIYRIRLLFRYNSSAWNKSKPKQYEDSELAVDYDTLREGVASYVDTLQGSGETTLAITQNGAEDALFIVDVRPLNGDEVPLSIDAEATIPTSVLLNLEDFVDGDVNTALKQARQQVNAVVDNPVRDFSELEAIQSIVERLVAHGVSNRTDRPLEEIPIKEDPQFINRAALERILEDVRPFVNDILADDVIDKDEKMLLYHYVQIMAMHIDDEGVEEQIEKTMRWMGRQPAVINIPNIAEAVIRGLDEYSESVDDETVRSIAQYHLRNADVSYDEDHINYLKQIASGGTDDANQNN